MKPLTAVTQVSLFLPVSEHPRSSVTSRTLSPRVATSDTPAAIAQSLLVGLAAFALICGLIVIISGCSSTDLDHAQRTFEHSATWPSPEDFDSWRRSGSLKCRDIPTLRICEASWKLFSPDDGKPFGKDRVTFACSTNVCAWVDP